jgi:uncharacterized protein (DUF1800 family)
VLSRGKGLGLRCAMKYFFSILLFICSAIAFAQQTALTAAQLNTFLSRVGFDASPAELASFSGLSQHQLAQRVVAQSIGNIATPAAPPWVADPPVTLKMRATMNVEERNTYRMQQNRQTVLLREWWLRGMIATPTPLRERMVLFWHNHFPSSQQKVIDTHLLWQQHQAMRLNALGDFKDLLYAVVQSPAMLEYLDAPQNRVQAPNENLARELMELFTLGEGNYSEQDVKQAAKALTGWSVNRNTNQFQFVERQHEPGIKHVLGMPVDRGGDVLGVLLMQKQTAHYITGKLWQEFISPVIDEKRVQVLSQQFYNSSYHIGSLMLTLLSEPALIADRNQAALVKSPVELLVGTVRRFGIAVPDERVLLQPLNAMGQVLFSHPSVKGWATGEGWINANTLLARKQAISSMINPPRNAAPMMGMQPQNAFPESENRAAIRPAAGLIFSPDAWLAQLQMPVHRSLNPAEQLALTNHVLHTAPAVPLDQSLEALPALKALLSDIAYQVK